MCKGGIAFKKLFFLPFLLLYFCPDIIPFDLPVGVDKAADGTALCVVAQIYDVEQAREVVEPVVSASNDPEEQVDLTGGEERRGVVALIGGGVVGGGKGDHESASLRNSSGDDPEMRGPGCLGSRGDAA